MPEKSSDAEVFLAFSRIVNFARDLNTQLPTPEIVFFGRKGHGKTTLLESVLGHPLSVVGNQGTKRPLIVNVINNLECSEPKITLKRDSVLKEHSNDLVISMEDLEPEISKRNIITPTPIVVNYEFKEAWNLTFIDTPGLAVPNDQSGEVSRQEIEEIVLEFARPAHRILICVEEVKDGAQSDMVTLAKKIDPKLDRTIFVFNKFADQLKTFTSTRELNRYMTATALPDAQYFFTSLLSNKERASLSSKTKFKARLAALQQEDLAALETLQYDKRYASSIGVVSFRRHLLELTWNKYQASIPELLKRLRSFKKKSEDSLRNISEQIKSLDSNKLRGNAARYTMQFLRNVEKLLLGTLEGNPAINGQTSAEEIAQDEAGEWFDVSYAPIRDPVTVPHAASKLYGGQQFERLLAEFHAVALQRQMSPVTDDDIAAAAGPQKLTNASNCSWAASDLAQRQIHRALLPLVDQLFRRAVYIMKRLVAVVESMMESLRRSKRRTGRPQDPHEELENYPFFTHAVKDLFYKFVDETAADCKSKCKDEFLSTRLIYWELSNLDGKAFSFSKGTSNKDISEAVTKLAQELFQKIKERIAKNIMLKTYNFFLVPMQTDLWGEIQGNITCLTDAQLEELFEVSVTKEKLADTEKDMQQILEKFAEQEDLFVGYANDFSKGTTRYEL